MLANIKAYFTAILINLQFYTSIPVKKELPLDKKHLAFALQGFPMLGLIQGVIYAGALFLLQAYTPFSILMQAFILWVLLIILSGGIHLDGWIDTSDAYFSFKEPDKRLEILKDPRVGAVGVLSVMVFLFLRFILIYEILTLGNEWLYYFIIAIPVLGKTMMGAFLQAVPLARKSGMAAFFHQGKVKRFPLIYGAYVAALGLFFIWVDVHVAAGYLIMMMVTLLCAPIIAGKIKKNFRGITGDTLGASSEGMELILWLTLWLLLSFAMV